MRKTDKSSSTKRSQRPHMSAEENVVSIRSPYSDPDTVIWGSYTCYLSVSTVYTATDPLFMGAHHTKFSPMFHHAVDMDMW